MSPKFRDSFHILREGLVVRKTCFEMNMSYMTKKGESKKFLKGESRDAFHI